METEKEGTTSAGHALPPAVEGKNSPAVRRLYKESKHFEVFVQPHFDHLAANVSKKNGTCWEVSAADGVFEIPHFCGCGVREH